MKLQRIVTSTVTTYLQRGFTALLSIACQIFSVDIIQNSLWRADRLLRIVEKGASVKKNGTNTEITVPQFLDCAVCTVELHSRAPCTPLVQQHKTTVPSLSPCASHSNMSKREMQAIYT